MNNILYNEYIKYLVRMEIDNFYLKPMSFEQFIKQKLNNL